MIDTTENSVRFETLLQQIESGDALVGVIGLGYVGLPLCHALHGGGLQVLGFDVDDSKIEALARGENYLKHLGNDMTLELSRSERFSSTVDFSRLGEAEVIIVCVPTPIGLHQEPDLSFVHSAAAAIGRCLRPGQLVILESTTFPGTTRDELLPHMLAASGDSALTCGRDFFVAYSPEREDPGRSDHSTRTIPKLVGGLDEPSTELAVRLYQRGLDEVIRVTSAEIAESAKLLENIFRSINIALVNEMKTILGAMDIDVWEVIDAASTKPFGFMPFYPGPGLGGHCIPIDPFYLSWKAREVGRPTRFIELAGAINTTMPAYVIQRTSLALNDVGKPVKGSRALVLGLAYKPDVDDTRESPSFEIIEQLLELGAVVDYSDPHISATVPVRQHDLDMRSVELTSASISSYDVVIIATNHSRFDYGMIAENASIVVDTRNALAKYADRVRGTLVKA